MGAKPYPAYKDSGVEWIGEIPEHWEVKRLGRSCVVSPKRNKSLLSNLEQLVSFLPMNAFNNDGTADYSNEVLLESVVNGYTYMEFGDIAISKVTPCFENGKAARLKNMPTKVGFGTTEITVIRPLRMFGDYVFYIFRVPDVVDIGVSWMYGVGGLQRIPDSFFEQLVTPFPPLEEQKQIASFLDRETSKIDTLIEKQQQLINLLKEKRGSLISYTVTKGLNPNVPMKDSGVEWIGEIPEHWEVKRVADLSTLVNGHPFASTGFSQDPGLPLVRIRDLTSVNFTTFWNQPYPTTSLIKQDDIVIGMDGDFNCIWWNRGDALLNQRLCLLRFSQGFSSRYAYYNLGYPLTAINEVTFYTTVKHLSSTQVKSIRIPSPPLEEQKRIAAFLDRETSNIDTLIEKANQSITLLKERRSSLISAAVTGKIDVRGAV